MTGNQERNAFEIESAFGKHNAESLTGWNILNLATGKEESVSPFGAASVKKSQRPRKLGGGAREGSMIFAPEINAKSFIHLSTRGSSYFLRDYSHSGPNSPPHKFKLKGCATLEEFRRKVRVEKEIDSTPEDMKMNIDTRHDHWFCRIESVNREYLS